MLCVRDSGRQAKFHRACVVKMRACMKHMAKENVGTSSTNTEDESNRETASHSSIAAQQLQREPLNSSSSTSSSSSVLLSQLFKQLVAASLDQTTPLVCTISIKRFKVFRMEL